MDIDRTAYASAALRAMEYAFKCAGVPIPPRLAPKTALTRVAASGAPPAANDQSAREAPDAALAEVLSRAEPLTAKEVFAGLKMPKPILTKRERQSGVEVRQLAKHGPKAVSVEWKSWGDEDDRSQRFAEVLERLAEQGYGFHLLSGEVGQAALDRGREDGIILVHRVGAKPAAEPSSPRPSEAIAGAFAELLEGLRERRFDSLRIVSTDHTPHQMTVTRVESGPDAVVVEGKVKRSKATLTIPTTVDAKGRPAQYAELRRGRSRRNRVDARRITAAAPLGGTKDTVPWNIWQHEVGLAAIREGAPAEYVNSAEGRRRLSTWFDAGESMKDATTQLVMFGKGWRTSERIRGEKELIEDARRRGAETGIGSPEARDVTARFVEGVRSKVGIPDFLQGVGPASGRTKAQRHALGRFDGLPLGLVSNAPIYDLAVRELPKRERKTILGLLLGGHLRLWRVPGALPGEHPKSRVGAHADAHYELRASTGAEAPIAPPSEPAATTPPEPEASEPEAPSPALAAEPFETEHQRRRRERAERKAATLKSRAQGHSKAARDLIKHIPPGQPILVGHHSERRHRRDLARHDAQMRKAVDTGEEAKSAEWAAARAGYSISSDDPDAIEALEVKLARLEARHTLNKAINAAYRKGGFDAVEQVPGVTKGILLAARTTLEVAPWMKTPTDLKNSGAEIRRIKKRIAELEAAAERVASPDIEGDGFTISEDPGDNRVRFEFDRRPDKETARKMKRAGFRFSRTHGAWQRHLNNAGIYAAHRMAKELFGWEKPPAQPKPYPVDVLEEARALGKSPEWVLEIRAMSEREEADMGRKLRAAARQEEAAHEAQSSATASRPEPTALEQVATALEVFTRGTYESGGPGGKQTHVDGPLLASPVRTPELGPARAALRALVRAAADCPTKAARRRLREKVSAHLKVARRHATRIERTYGAGSDELRDARAVRDAIERARAAIAEGT